MREFIRKKRTMASSFPSLELSVEKRADTNNMNGILQALLNIATYILIYLLFFRSHLANIGMFIAFMAASVITQLILRFRDSFEKTVQFPFFRIVYQPNRYDDYLTEVENKVICYQQKYARFLKNSHVSCTQYAEIIQQLKEPLYMRLKEHDDFLQVDLGNGHIRYPVKLHYPEYSYTEHDFSIELFKQKMEERMESSMDLLPVFHPLSQERVFAIVNRSLSEKAFTEAVNAAVMSIAFYHAPLEVTMGFVLDPEKEMDWVRFLPHVWDGERRLIYDGSEPIEEFMEQYQNACKKPKSIVMVIDADVLRKEGEIYSRFNTEELPENVHVLFYSFSGNAPTRADNCMECVRKPTGSIGSYNGKGVLLNMMSYTECAKLAKQLSNLKVIDNRKSALHGIPENLSFYELMKVQYASKLPKASVEENAEIQDHFPVAVGMGVDHRKIEIDLSNKGDGNHCLVTGTTGSGKSKFLLTYLLSACSRYSPEYFSFVVIDFKGGSMSSEIQNLPHCRGEFTNLKGNVTKRDLSRIAELLKSEISYRQRVMAEAGCQDNLATYHRKYQKDGGKTMEALPRLLIVVDEVSVFFSTDPEAVSYLTHIATVGRSAGMILLLATQSKNGVIPNQVRTNINVKVDFYGEDDLKKNTEQIKGRALINSAKKTNVACQVALCSVYDTNQGAVDFMTISAKARYVKGVERYPQSDSIIKEIRKRYPEVGEEIFTLPLEDIDPEVAPAVRYLKHLYEVTPKKGSPDFNGFPIGVADDIYDRNRDVVTIEPGKRNLLVYGVPESGKTTLIKTVLASLCNRHYGLRPSEVGIYLISSNPLKYNSYRYPQVGSILPKEELYYFLLFLRNEISQRKRTKGEIPLVAIIDNCYSEIQNSEVLSGMLKEITAESVKYNISIIMTLSTKATYFSKIPEGFQDVITFRLEEESDYRSLVHPEAIRSVPFYPGRCLVHMPSLFAHTLETQIVLPFVESEKEIEEEVREYRSLWGDKPLPKKLPLMPETVRLPYGDLDEIPVGIGNDLEVHCWNVRRFNTYLVSYLYDPDAVSFMSYLAKAFAAAGYRNVCVVDNQRGALKALREETEVTYFEQEELEDLLKHLCEPSIDKQKPVVLIYDYSRLIMQNTSELTGKLMELVRSRQIIGVFAEHKDYQSSARMHPSRFAQFLEGNNCGMLIGNTPASHTFGASALPAFIQMRPLSEGWGIHVSPDTRETCPVKLGKVVEA